MPKNLEAEIIKELIKDSAEPGQHPAAVKKSQLETKNSLQALLSSETRYRRLFESAQDGILILNAETGEIDDVNPYMIDMLHYSREEFLGMKLWEVSPFKDTVFNRAAFEELQEKGYIRYKDLPLETKEGKPVAVEFVSNVYKANGNKVIQCNIRNITERMEMNQKLQEAVIFQQQLIDALPVPVFYKDSEGSYLGCNSSFEKFFGQKREQITGKSVYEVASQEFADIYHEKDLALLQNPGVQTYESTVKDTGGTAHNVIFHKATFLNRDGSVGGLIGAILDITDRKRSEEEKEKLLVRLIQSQKMEAIGTLAGGIAHDFNNILSAIFGYTELALTKIDAETEIKADLKKVLLGAERAKDLVKQILAFSRQTQKEQKPVQVGLIAKEALNLIRSSLPATIDIRQNILSKSIVLSDPTQLHQIVMNLCTNAAHAMQEKGGILEVTLTDVALDSDFCLYLPEIEPGDYLKLSVSDTGYGMTADVMNRIFDPFFTTKLKDQGTGLGLSVVHGIVKDCGGTITVHSKPDKGATFNLYFPIIKGRAKEKFEEYTIIPTGTERILVVDDEKAIIETTQKILTSLGYEVEVRASSFDALELFKTIPAKFDLVITDMTMPQMTGDALARELIKIRPDLPVILCTGFSEKMTNEKAETMGIKAFLMKPLLKEEMAHTIRRVLDE